MNIPLSQLSEMDADLQLDSRLVRHARWLCRIRLVLALALLVGVLAGWGLGQVSQPLAPALIALILLAYNLLFMLIMRSAKDDSTEQTGRLCAAQVLADMVSLTALVFLWGGVENPIVIFYVGPVATAGLLLQRRISYLAATAALLMVSAVAVVQAAFPSLHHPLPFDFPAFHYHRWSFVVLVLAIVGPALFLTAYITTTIRARLRHAAEHVVGSRNVLNAIISCMNEAVIFLSPEGRVLLVNPSFCRWFGHAGEDGHEELDLPQGIRNFVERFSRAVEPLGPEMFPLVMKQQQSEPPERRFTASASSVRDARGQHLGYVIVVEDITEQWHLEQSLRNSNREIMAMSEALQRSQREMAQREKMSAIGTMAAGIAHEIGNPLAGLSAIIDLLVRRQPRPEQVDHLDTMRTQVDRIAKIVRQLVEFARPACPERSLVDLNELVEETLLLLQYSRRGRKAEIQSLRRSDLPPVLVNPQQFQQVLLNLLLNALDAIDDEKWPALIRLERGSIEGYVTVSVRDWGCGMTEEQLRMVFEPFFTTKPPNRGTGLGLAVSSRLVESHGGSISMQSAPGQGTTVTVAFPVAAAVPPPSSEALAEKGRPQI